MHHHKRTMLVSAKSPSSAWIPSKRSSRNSCDDDTSIVDVFQSILSCSFNDYAVEAGVTKETGGTGSDGGGCSASLLLPSCGTSSSSALHHHHHHREEDDHYDHPQPQADPYEMLQIRVDASPSEIREAYRKLALWHHPQRCLKHCQIHSPELEERQHVFQLLAASYETLIDTETRTRYNYLRRVEQKKARQRRKLRPRRQDKKTTLSRQQPHMRSWYPRKKVVPVPLDQIHDTSLVDDVEEDWMDSDCESSHTSGSHTTTSTDYEFLETFSPSSQQQQHQLQGGPLSRLLKARNYQPFTDPLMIFRKVFETDLFIHTNTTTMTTSPPSSLSSFISKETALSPTSSLTSNHNHNHNTSLYQTIPKSPPRSAAWTGSRTIEQDGVILSTTTRIRSNRKITRTERITVDPTTGKKHKHISVLSEEVETKFTNVAAASQRSPKCCGSDASASWYSQCCAPLLCL